MDTAELIETVDLNYKNGYVQCACGWRKELGNGFNGYHISNCPSCTPDLSVRHQRKVMVGKVNNLTVTIGDHVYFVIKGCIHVQYSKRVDWTYYGLTERQADKL